MDGMVGAPSGSAFEDATKSSLNAERVCAHLSERVLIERIPRHPLYLYSAS